MSRPPTGRQLKSSKNPDTLIDLYRTAHKRFSLINRPILFASLTCVTLAYTLLGNCECASYIDRPKPFGCLNIHLAGLLAPRFRIVSPN